MYSYTSQPLMLGNRSKRGLRSLGRRFTSRETICISRVQGTATTTRWYAVCFYDIAAACGTRLARCEFTLEDSARLGVDPAALESGSPGLAPLREASDNPSADVLARAHDAVVDNCKKSRYFVCTKYLTVHQQRTVSFEPATRSIS